MTQRLVLLGAKAGSWCSIGGIRRQTLRIRGLAEGKIQVELKNDSVEAFLNLGEDGDYPLPERFQWVRAVCDSPSLVCLVIPQVA